MADFIADFQSLRPSFPFSDIDPSTEPVTGHFTEINQTVQDNSNSNNYHSLMQPFSSDNFFAHQPPEFSGNLAENFPAVFHQNSQNVVVPVSGYHQPFATPGIECENHDDGRKRKTMVDVSESNSINSSPQVSESGTKRKKNSTRGKRVRSSEEEEEKQPREVVHVRARRGQATDSHSLAERVRRGKINERLRCLQNIVPGCYKTMGMAVMLDEIINYVQSLQNQVEFLSMKLTAASTFYDFNAEPDVMETMQRAKAQEAKEMERMAGERHRGHGYFQPSWSL